MSTSGDVSLIRHLLGSAGVEVRVGHPIVLKDLLDKFFLRQGEGAFLMVPGNLDAQDPSHFAEIGHLIKLTKGLLILEDSFEAF